LNSLEAYSISKDKVEAELCRRSFYFFSKEAFKQLHNGKEIDTNWHIEFICDKLQELAENLIKGNKREKHLIINVPPRTLKSELTNVFFSIWLWVRKPDIQFVSSSYSHGLSLKLSLAARRIIESDWFIKLFPDIQLTKDENTKSVFSNTQGGLRYTTSTGGTITGMGGDVIVIDDPQNPQLARSEVERTNANLFFDETLRSRLNDPEKGIFIIIMQRLHEKDLTGHLISLEPDKWEHINLPAEVTQTIKPRELSANYTNGLLFEKRLNREVLQGLRIGLGSYGYSGQYLQMPSPAEGGIIKKHWFEIVEEKKLVFDMFVDTAYTSKTSNDPTSILIGAKEGNLFYVKNIIRVWQEFPELIKTIKENAVLYAIKKIYIEPKASGKSIVQQLKKETMLNVIEAPPPDKDKVSRVNAVAPIIESGRVKLIDGIYITDFLDECATFPNGQHDDQIDTLTMLLSNNNKSFLNQYV
jgi:predicted phage terminase large subunit-like protein